MLKFAPITHTTDELQVKLKISITSCCKLGAEDLYEFHHSAIQLPE